MPRKKRFIDPKHSVTFELVPRSQVDPLALDDNAPRNVLIEKKSRQILNPDYDHPEKTDRASRLKEQRSYGIYFDDEYDYLQHLRDVCIVERKAEPFEVLETGVNASGNSRLLLPSSVFPSYVQEKHGLHDRCHSRSGPRPELDPEVLAALESDNEDSELLEDDFVAIASGGADHIEDFGNGIFPVEDYRDENVNILRLEDDICSVFTDYSLSSSIMTRNKNLSTLDEQFERNFEENYGVGAIGCLEDRTNDVDAQGNSHILQNITEQYFASKYEKDYDSVHSKAHSLAAYDREEEVAPCASLEENSEKMHYWDCESVLTLKTTIFNRPTIINTQSLKLNKSGVPCSEKLNKRNLQALTGSATQQLAETRKNVDEGSTYSSARGKGETTDERKLRKQLVKNSRRERRTEKKNSSITFKAERLRQQKQECNLRQNLEGLKLN